MVLDSGNVITHLSLFYSSVLMAHIKQTTFLHCLVISAVPFPHRGDKSQLDINVPVDQSSTVNQPAELCRHQLRGAFAPLASFLQLAATLHPPFFPHHRLAEEQEELGEIHTLLRPMCFSERCSSLPLSSTEQVRTCALGLDTSQKRVGPSKQSTILRDPGASPAQEDVERPTVPPAPAGWASTSSTGGTCLEASHLCRDTELFSWWLYIPALLR